MSRIGNRPIKIEEGVMLAIDNQKVVASFGENKQELSIPEGIKISQSGDWALVARDNSTKDLKSKHGLIARLLINAIAGVRDGFTRVLEFTGTGYRAAVVGDELVLNMGYSHEIRFNIPKTLNVTIVKNRITIKGIKKEEVGQFAAIVRQVRPPEVYKGKGIKYKEELIKRKAGKTAASK